MYGSGRLAGALLALGLLIGCGPSAGETLTAARAALDTGDDLASQQALRDGLERHPEDLDLLLFACDFYLREAAEAHYKPRLALHYASRARRVDTIHRPDIAVALVRSLRAMGQHDDAATELDQALALCPDHPELVALALSDPFD